MAKKTFPCGHKGKGQYCHRCLQEDSLRKKEIQRKNDQQMWKDSFDNDPVDLRRLSAKGLVKKARKIISDIHEGLPYTSHKGKRMQFDRCVISVPLNRDWRIIFHDTDGLIRCSELMSHEEYNIKKPGEKP